MDRENGEKGMVEAYPVQYHIDIPACVNDGGFAAQLDDFAEHADELVLEGLEVRGKDAGGLGVVHCLVVFLAFKCWFGG